MMYLIQLAFRVANISSQTTGFTCEPRYCNSKFVDSKILAGGGGFD